MSGRGWLVHGIAIVASILVGGGTNWLLGVNTDTAFTLGLVGGVVTVVAYVLLLRLVVIGRSR